MVPFARIEACSAFGTGSPSNLLLFWFGKFFALFLMLYLQIKRIRKRESYNQLQQCLTRTSSIRFFLKGYVKRIWEWDDSMNDYQERLTKRLLSKNDQLTYNQALTWVELLWDDFETSSAKAGRKYQGSEMTEKIVQQWIDYYGEKFHEFVATNPKYRHFLNQGENRLN